MSKKFISFDSKISPAEGKFYTINALLDIFGLEAVNHINDLKDAKTPEAIKNKIVAVSVFLLEKHKIKQASEFFEIASKF